MEQKEKKEDKKKDLSVEKDLKEYEKIKKRKVRGKEIKVYERETETQSTKTEAWKEQKPLT